MLAALSQARLALDAGNMPIVAVIVHNGTIIAVGRNAIDHPANDTHHAELSAIQSVASFLAEHKRQCTIYTTLEPCMMCLGAIINVGIQTIVTGAAAPLVGAIGLLPHNDYYKRKESALQLVSGFMAEESQALLNDYVLKTGLRAHLATQAT
jgi:tRNA(adenine34) deaminase